MDTFREWLLTEADSSEFFQDVLTPSNADSWSAAVTSPVEMKQLKYRWGKEKKEGRKFHNIDLDSISKIKYLDMQSRSMPDAGPGFWTHRADDGRPDVVGVEDSDLDLYGIAPNSKSRNVLHTSISKHIDYGLDKKFGTFVSKLPSEAR